MTRAEAETIAAALATMPAPDAFKRGIALLNADYPEELLPAARLLAGRRGADARASQLLGLAARATGDGPLAWRAFRQAAQVAPHDPLIAHSRARAALEAGHPATALFEAARRLAPTDGGVLQGLAAALTAEGRPQDALDMLHRTLAASPLWLDGHRSFARIAAQSGGDPLRTLDAALAALPAHAELHQLTIATLLEAGLPERAAAAIAAARRALGAPVWLTRLAAHAASERGDLSDADALFAAAPPPADAEQAGLLARHLIRSDRPQDAIAVAERWLNAADGAQVRPYRDLARRQLEGSRTDSSDGDDAFVGVYDLEDELADIAGLADVLRSLHRATAAPLDQSVRGGTQTDGHLLLRDDPAIQALRRTILATTARHISGLPAPRPRHPTLLPRRDPLRIAGAWSVRLTGAGYHEDHVHPQGWFSSALYLALPDTLGRESGGDPHAGWLQLGTSRTLTPSLAPTRVIEPRVGRLVLFPSTLWHGTLPFAAGERLTVAFDIARPRQDGDGP